MPHLRTLNITSEFSWGIYFFLDFDISCPSLHCEQDKDRPSTTQFSVRGMTPYAMPILHAWEATLYLLNGCPIRGEMTKIAYPPPVKVSRVEISVVDTVIHGRENESVMLQSRVPSVVSFCYVTHGVQCKSSAERRCINLHLHPSAKTHIPLPMWLLFWKRMCTMFRIISNKKSWNTSPSTDATCGGAIVRKPISYF